MASRAYKKFFFPGGTNNDLLFRGTRDGHLGKTRKMEKSVQPADRGIGVAQRKGQRLKST